MTAQEIIMRMYPFWILGFTMLMLVWNSKYRNLLRIEKTALYKFIGFLVILNIYRVIMFKFVLPHDLLQQMTEGASMIPWPMTLTVFWEDMCHGVPLVLMSMMMSKKKWYYKPLYYTAFGLTMVSFGLGHLYQGWLAVLALSFYIPFSIKYGKKYGFGTVMLAHMMYDLTTILAIKFFVG